MIWDAAREQQHADRYFGKLVEEPMTKAEIRTIKDQVNIALGRLFRGSVTSKYPYEQLKKMLDVLLEGDKK